MKRLMVYFCETMGIRISKRGTEHTPSIIDTKYSLEARHSFYPIDSYCEAPFEAEVFIHGLIDQEIAKVISQIINSGFERNCINNAIETLHGDYSIIVRSGEGILAFCSLESTLPLFFKDEDNTLVVSSDHMCIVKDVKESLSVHGVARAVFGDSVFPFSGINLLNAGEYLLVHTDRQYALSLGKVQAALPPCMAAKNNKSFEDIVAVFQRRFSRSLYELVKGANRIGLLLSGGIDSSLIAWYLRQLSCDVVLYTWSGPSFPQTDEWNDAHLVAEITEFPHKRVMIDNDALFEHIFLYSHIDIPFFHNYSGAWLVSCEQMARDGIDIVLSGYGASQFEAPQYSLAHTIRQLPIKEKCAEIVHALANPYQIPRDILYKRQQKDEAIPFLRNIDFFTESNIDLIQNTNHDLPVCPLQEYIQEKNLFIPTGIRCLHPYHTQPIIELAASIPESCKTRMFMGQQVNKLVLRTAMLGKLPDRIVRKTYPAAMSALIQKKTAKWFQMHSAIKELEPLIDLGIVDALRLKTVINNTKLTMANAQALHTSLLFSYWYRTK